MALGRILTCIPRASGIAAQPFYYRRDTGMGHPPLGVKMAGRRRPAAPMARAAETADGHQVSGHVAVGSPVWGDGAAQIAGYGLVT